MDAQLPAENVSRRDVIKRGLKVGGAVYVAPTVLAALAPGSVLAQVTPAPTATTVPPGAPPVVPPTATTVPPTATTVPPGPFAQCGVSADAFGASLTTPSPLPITLAPVGRATLPPGQDVTVLSASVPGILTTGVITDRALNVSTSTQSSAVASSLVNGLALNLLATLGITATTIQTSSTSTSNRVTASSSGATVVENLVINGTPITVNPAPNTRINLPGVGYVVINEQITTGNGTTAAALTVRGLHVVITTALPLLGLPVGAEVIIASSNSSVSCT